MDREVQALKLYNPEIVTERDSERLDKETATIIKIPDTVKTIQDGVFRNFRNTENFILSENIESIGKSAFWDCEKIKDIALPESVSEIGENAFGKCKELTEIKIPKNIDKINAGTFRYCINLSKVELPNNIQSIGAFAFSYCENMEAIAIPSTVKEIGEKAFEGCQKLQYIVYDGDNLNFSNAIEKETMIVTQQQYDSILNEAEPDGGSSGNNSNITNSSFITQHGDTKKSEPITSDFRILNDLLKKESDLDKEKQEAYERIIREQSNNSQYIIDYEKEAEEYFKNAYCEDSVPEELLKVIKSADLKGVDIEEFVDTKIEELGLDEQYCKYQGHGR